MSGSPGDDRLIELIAAQAHDLRYIARRLTELAYPPNEVRKRRQKWADERRQRMNDRLRETADRNGYVWTGPELELANRPDLTAQEAAIMLGRTLRAVKGARNKLRKDPRFQALAG